MFIAGVHVPIMPLIDVVGSGAMNCPTQKGPTGVKLGVVFGFTTMVIVAVVPHCPPLGVKV